MNQDIFNGSVKKMSTFAMATGQGVSSSDHEIASNGSV